MKTALRLIISGLAIALVVLLCVFVFFKPNNAVEAYNTLTNGLSENGCITTMENTIEETVINKGNNPQDIPTLFPNYKIITSELGTLKSNYGKMLLYDNDKDASEALKNRANQYIEEVKTFNIDLDNYKRTVESGISQDNVLSAMERDLDNLMKRQCEILSELNILIFKCLNDGYYKGYYTYNVAIQTIASIYSDKINNEDPTISESMNSAYLALKAESNKASNYQDYEGANKFLTLCWSLDIVKIFTSGQVYIDTLSDTDKQNAQYVFDYISNIIQAEVA